MKDNLKSLAEELGLPAEITAALGVATKAEPATEERICRLLFTPEGYANGAKELSEMFSSDKDGVAVLRVMLLAALRSRSLYAEKGIPDDVFLDTMKCFTRFVTEHRESYGRYGFDRGFWVGRQLSLLLFRIGTLEYEMTEREGRKAISIHIPSNSDLSEASLDCSIAAAKAFFARFYPEYESAEYFCCSWLLSPSLKELLSPASKIIGFQNRFQIISVDETPESYKQWVFKNKTLAPEQFPEHTSLQRSMKAHVLSGGKIGEALGTLKA